MNTYSFKLPDIGEGIAQAEIASWHARVGDWVEEDSPIADMMTDKATVEMTAPVSGKLVKVAGEVGDQIAIGAILAVFETDGNEGAVPAPAEPRPVLASAPAGPDQAGAPALADTASAPAIAAVEPATPEHQHRILASPAVRQRARELAIDLRDVRPDSDGRIRHADLDAFVRYSGAAGYRTAESPRADEAVKVMGLRRRIAENMAASKRSIPHFSYVEEIDVTKLEALRAELNASRGNRSRLTILPLLVTALCRAIPDYPMMNAIYDDEAGIVTRKGAVHLGVATQTDNGLMVPVLRDAQSCNLWQIASEISRLADAARSGKARSEELAGSTITMTSLGPLGGIATTPVINRPEVAIVGPNRIIERPVFRDGRIEPAKLMNLLVSCDHRVVDGWDAARFVQAVKRLLEAPALLFVD